MIMVRIIHNDTPTASYWEEIIADKNGAKKECNYTEVQYLRICVHCL